MASSEKTTEPPLTPAKEVAWAIFDRMHEIMRSGDWDAMTKASQEVASFPLGTDPALQRHWLTNAVDAGAPSAVEWMIGQKVEVSYLDDEGFSPLMSATDIKDEQARYAILRLLLKAGSRHDLVGSNAWTAAHFAASAGDVGALKILAEFGADLCASTEDLGSWRTPVDAARRQGHREAVTYLEDACRGAANRMYRANC